MRLSHVLAILAGWVIFGLLWWRVLARPHALTDIRTAVLLVVAALVVVTAVTWTWVVHNVSLARRRGGRNSIVALRMPAEDRLGRRFDVSPEATTASYVVVSVDGPVKSFRRGEQHHG